MNIRARVGSADLRVYEASISWRQNEIAEFDVLILESDVSFMPDIDIFTTVEVYIDGEAVITGYAYDRPKLEWVDGLRRVLARIPCYEDMGRLMCRRRKPDSHYQDEQVTDILLDLLINGSSDFELGDTSTMLDATITTTIDLRSKETLWAQVMAVVESIPKCFVRSGGLNAASGRWRVDIGFFGEEHPEGAIQGYNLATMSREKSFARVYRVVHAIGGKSGDEVVTLEDALNANPLLATDPDYPIQLLDGEYCVVNNLVTVGCEISKQFSENKTKNDEPPDSTDIGAAGIALYQNTVRFLQENVKEINVSANVFFAQTPLISDRVYIKGKAREEVWDNVSQQARYRETFHVDRLFRMVGITLRFEDASYASSFSGSGEGAIDTLTYELECTDGDYGTFLDPDLEVYKRLERFDELDLSEAATSIKVVTRTRAHGPGDASNCTAGGYNGKSFNIALPTPPSWATSVAIAFSITPSDYQVTVTQYPSLPATGFQACVSDSGGTDWTIASAATLTVQFIFT